MPPACPSAEDSPPLAVFASFSGEGGVERMLINLMHGWLDLGQRVDLVLVRDRSRHLVHLAPEVRRIPLGVSHTALAAPALARYLRQQRPAALLAAKDRAGRAAVLARALAGTPTRLVLRLGTHLSTALQGRAPVTRWLRLTPMRWFYPRLDAIVAVSQGVAEDTARLSGVPRSRIQVIRNPVITPQLSHLAAAPCPHPWLAPGQPPVVLGIGRLERQKDFPTLLRAFARIGDRDGSRLLILGEGGGRAALLDLARTLGLAERILFPGFVDNPYAYLARARLFVLSSRWEGSPNALTEALALGVPAVATDCPSGPAELLDGGRHAPLVPVGDVAALAAAIRHQLATPPDPARLRAAVAEYEQARSARRYLQVLGLLPDAAEAHGL